MPAGGAVKRCATCDGRGGGMWGRPVLGAMISPCAAVLCVACLALSGRHAELDDREDAGSSLTGHAHDELEARGAGVR